jgi:hypothetical protein
LPKTGKWKRQFESFGWPYFNPLKPSNKKTLSFIFSNTPEENQHYVTAVSWHAHRVLQVTNSWMLIDSGGLKEVSSAEKASLRHFIPAYLVDFCKRKHAEWRAAKTTPEWHRNIANDIFVFAEKSHGLTQALRDAVQNVRNNHLVVRSRSFFELLLDFVSRNQVNVMPEGFAPSDSKLFSVTFDTESNTLKVEKRMITTLLQKKHITSFNVDEMTPFLDEAGLLIGDSEEHWLLNYQEYIAHRDRAKRHKLLRVVG